MPEPETYPLVEDAKRMRAKGVPIRKICEVMEERSLGSQRGKIIGPSSMFKLLSYPCISWSQEER